MVHSEQEAVGDPITLPEDGLHAGEQQPAEEQFLTEHGVEDDEHHDHGEPAPGSAEEGLATVGAEEVAEIPHRGTRDEPPGPQLPDGDEDGEGERPPPHLAAHASGLRILGWSQPEGVANARPLESTELPPDEDHDQHELPDEPRREADQQRSGQWFVAPELVFEPGSDDPGQDSHRDGGCCPHRKDLAGGVLLDGLMPTNRHLLRGRPPSVAPGSTFAPPVDAQQGPKAWVRRRGARGTQASVVPLLHRCLPGASGRCSTFPA